MMVKYPQAPLSLFGRAKLLLMKRNLLLCLAILLITACTKTDEEKRLAKFRKTISYKTYRFTSEKATVLALEEYNKALDVSLEPPLVHAMIGFVCLIGKKNEYALIEADLAKESPSAETAILAMGVQSIALTKLHCSHLALEQYTKLKSALASLQKNTPSRLEDVQSRLMFASLIAVSLYQNDAELATFSAKTLGAHTQFDYLPSLVSALVEIKKGHSQKALEHLQEISQRKNFPEAKRIIFAESIALIAKTSDQTRDKDAMVDELILQLLDVLLKDLFANDNQQLVLKKISALSEQFTKGFPSLIPSITNSPGASATAQ